MPLARLYAGLLGPLAFAVTLLRALLWGGSLTAVKSACLALAVFTVIGLIVGQIAESIVQESVKARFQAAMAEWEASGRGKSQEA